MVSLRKHFVSDKSVKTEAFADPPDTKIPSYPAFKLIVKVNLIDMKPIFAIADRVCPQEH